MKRSHGTALLGAAIFGFSVVTIIFTPMAFVVALPGVPDDSLFVGPIRERQKRVFVGKWTSKSKKHGASLLNSFDGFRFYRRYRYRLDLPCGHLGLVVLQEQVRTSKQVRTPRRSGKEKHRST